MAVAQVYDSSQGSIRLASSWLIVLCHQLLWLFPVLLHDSILLCPGAASLVYHSVLRNRCLPPCSSWLLPPQPLCFLVVSQSSQAPGANVHPVSSQVQFGRWISLSAWLPPPRHSNLSKRPQMVSITPALCCVQGLPLCLAALCIYGSVTLLGTLSLQKLACSVSVHCLLFTPSPG